tara:strand:- start:446 stop:1180 length:735 start_codon:yes stop_codon:yes gene_type:complete
MSPARNLLRSDVNFIFIPKMYYGSSIKKGSVNLKFFVTGSKIAECKDERHNGELIETTGPKSGSVIGIVLYDEGVLMLTASHTLGPNDGIQYTDSSAVNPSWMYYGTTLYDQYQRLLRTGTSWPTLASSSYSLDFKGVNYVNTMTVLAHAPKGQLNHSNNPTYADKVKTHRISTSSADIFSEKISSIKNIFSASHTSASFQKVTYISKVNLYDENNNLIGIASLAKPIRKTEDIEYNFKLRLDI